MFAVSLHSYRVAFEERSGLNLSTLGLTQPEIALDEETLFVAI